MSDETRGRARERPIVHLDKENYGVDNAPPFETLLGAPTAFAA